eukprot:GEMP01005639.1.p1 GENE.GEMP01005639.1~~GEMP01005639.1.p1  ORF type:complete len:814 (+),score=126.22 GEMP01005639.1:110-2551(+)
MFYAGQDVYHVLIIVGPPIFCSLLSLGFAMYLNVKLLKNPTGKDAGIDKVDKLAAQIKSGAKSFLKVEYKYLTYFVSVMAIILLVLFSLVGDVGEKQLWKNGLRIFSAFLLGAILSASAGWFGMNTATDGNVRTTVACAKGNLNDGLKVAFCCGSVMAFIVVGLGLLGLSLMYLLLSIELYSGEEQKKAWQLLAGFGFGASSIALFARVAGGIYTKAADVGADLVGKVEAGIDEDDPHNPAVIADNVGDNVGDVAGMGADLFESYVGSMIAAAAIATSSVLEFSDVDSTVLDAVNWSVQGSCMALPLWISSVGILSSIVGFFFVSTKSEGAGWDVKLSELFFALEKGMYVAGALFIALAALVIYLLFGLQPPGVPEKETQKIVELGWKCYGCIIIGLVAGVLIGKVTEYFTSFDFGPVISIKDRAVTGPATVVIQGLGVGMISCLPPIIILAATIFGCEALAGDYGIAIAAVGMLATLGITLATDAYGPVADNAGGLAEMAGLGPQVRQKTDSLDALGNTTAATGKGFAIGSAVLTSLSLMSAFKDQLSGNFTYSVTNSNVLAGVLIGAMLPMLFASLTMISVGKAAAEIIHEVRRQFNEIPGLRAAIEKASRGEPIPPEEDVDPDSDRCVEISTRSSVREMVAPGTYAILAPVIVGLLVGAECLMGLLAGSIASGAVLGIMMSNAGGAWDNSKKLCEKLDIKKTDVGKACVVGDTVGDPFKDTSGPSLNILIKLMSMISLTIAPIIRSGTKPWQQAQWGVIPLVLCLLITAYLMWSGALSWKDPLADLSSAEANDSPTGPKEEARPESLAAA